MTTTSRRRSRWPLATALGLIAGVPALAEAQLFPNLPIKRERPCCDAEAPMFRLYRHQYYGYHPTCWRRFPPGWGCPSPETPNSLAAMEDIRRDLERTPADFAPPDGGLPPEGPEPMRPGGPDDNPFPSLPSGDRNPFELDSPDGGLPGGDLDRGMPGDTFPPDPAGPGIRPAPVGPRTGLDSTPLDALPPAEGAFGPAESDPSLEFPATEANAAGDRSGSTVALLDVGNDSPPPTRVGGAMAEEGFMPFPPSPEASSPNAPMMPMGIEPMPGPPEAVQAPQRRGRIGSLFQNLGRRRR